MGRFLFGCRLLFIRSIHIPLILLVSSFHLYLYSLSLVSIGVSYWCKFAFIRKTLVPDEH